MKTREELEVELGDLWAGLLAAKEWIAHTPDCRIGAEDTPPFSDLRCDCGARAAHAEAEELLEEVFVATVKRDASPVIVFDLGKPELVFHLFEAWEARPHPVKLDDGWIRNEHRTRCGLLTWAVEWRDVDGRLSSETRAQIDRGTALRRDHASRIGRLCERCGR